MVGIPHEPERNPNPNTIHKDDVYPEIPDLGGVKVGVSSDPFRAESHPPSIKFSSRQNNDPEVPRGVVADKLADDVTAQRPSAENSEDFNRDDDWICQAPTEIDVCVFFPHIRQRTLTPIHGPTECREVQPRRFVREVDQSVECQPEEREPICPRGGFWECLDEAEIRES